MNRGNRRILLIGFVSRVLLILVYKRWLFGFVFGLFFFGLGYHSAIILRNCLILIFSAVAEKPSTRVGCRRTFLFFRTRWFLSLFRGRLVLTVCGTVRDCRSGSSTQFGLGFYSAT